MGKELDSLSGPERIVVTRLVEDEPLIVVNAWLRHNGFNPVDDSGLSSLKVRHNQLINDLRSRSSELSIFDELVSLKNLLIKSSQETDNPKDIAQLSNSINSVSKTIDGLIERQKGSSEEEIIDVEELMGVLCFLEVEGIIRFEKEKKNELRKCLLETVSQE